MTSASDEMFILRLYPLHIPAFMTNSLISLEISVRTLEDLDSSMQYIDGLESLWISEGFPLCSQIDSTLSPLILSCKMRQSL